MQHQGQGPARSVWPMKPLVYSLTASATTISATTSLPESRWTRPGLTPSRAELRVGYRGLKAATSTWWGCRVRLDTACCGTQARYRYAVLRWPRLDLYFLS